MGNPVTWEGLLVFAGALMILTAAILTIAPLIIMFNRWIDSNKEDF